MSLSLDPCPFAFEFLNRGHISSFGKLPFNVCSVING